MPKVAVYTRATTGGSRRRYVKATRGSTGPFFLRYEINGKRVWEGLGTRTYTFALADARSKESSLLREEATPPKPSPAAPKSVEELRTAFIHDKKTTFKKDGTPLDPDTISSYEKVTREFLDIIKKSTPAQITKQDLKDWMVKQRERVSHRTVCNLYISIACFLHFCGVDHKKLLPQSERPSPVEETPEAYTEEEMTKFFFVITRERDALAFELMLKTGPREQELANLEWEHLDLGKTPTVSYKTRDNFRTKTGKSRTVPLERGLADRLAEWRVKNPTSLLLFPTEQGKVEGHFLRLCKEYAKLSGQQEMKFWLHKFRDTFATWALRRGVDIRTVQHWLGHASIEMTQRYLAPEQGEHAQGQINKAFGSFDTTSPLHDKHLQS
jgi:integrase